MIIRRHRFHGYGSLKRVYARGGKARAGLLSLRYSQREPGKPYRVAVVVSRKVHKSAVVRNRIRRRIYEIVRHHEEAVPKSTDLVFTVFGDQVATIEPSQLKSQIIELLKKASG